MGKGRELRSWVGSPPAQTPDAGCRVRDACVRGADRSQSRGNIQSLEGGCPARTPFEAGLWRTLLSFGMKARKLAVVD